MTRKVLDTGQLTVMELEWFSRNSYNLALQHCATWEPQHVLRLLNACIKVNLNLPVPHDCKADLKVDC